MGYGIVYHQSNLNRKDRLEIKKALYILSNCVGFEWWE